MDADELFSFDVRGFVVVRNAVGAVAALAGGGGGPAEQQAAAAVLGSPLLRQYVMALLHPEGSPRHQGPGTGSVLLDLPVEALPQVEGVHVLADGAHGGERRWARRVGSEAVVRYAQGLRVVVAAASCPAGAGGLFLVPASHNSELPAAPAEVLAGGAPELCVQPVLEAGDAVLMAPGLVAFLRPWTLPTPQRLLRCEFIPPQTR